MADVSNLVLVGGVDTPKGSHAGSEFMMPRNVMATPATAPPVAGSVGNGASTLPRVGKRGAPQAFARKLYEILTTESTAVIAWNAQGTAFHVKDVETFSEQTLTRYYRHSKFSSFQRQLNLYSFRKIVKGPDTGGYAHPMFHRDRPDDLYHVRRSISSSSASSPKSTARSASVEIHSSVVRKGAGRAAQKATTAAAWSSVTGVPRAYKCKAATRRVGKVRHAGNKVTKMRGTKKNLQQHAAAAAVVSSGGLAAAADGGERGAWTTGESSSDNESDPEMEGVDRSASTSDDEAGEEGEEGDSLSDNGREAEGSDCRQKQKEEQQQQQLLRGWARDGNKIELPPAAAAAAAAATATVAAAVEGGDERRELSFSGLFSKRFTPHSNSSGSRGISGARSREGAGRGEGEGEGRTAFSSFFKKTFSGGSFSSFIEKHHRRGMSTSSVDMVGGETDNSSNPSTAATAPTVGSDSNASVATSDPTSDNNDSNNDENNGGAVSREALAANQGSSSPSLSSKNTTANSCMANQRPTVGSAAGAPVVPPVSVKDNNNNSNNGSQVSATADAAAMPPPRTPSSRGREELGLVEQLTNMVEVFDICDLLRRVSTSGRPLDKEGNKLTSPFGGSSASSRQGSSQHLRQMSVDTDAGVPVSPAGRDGSTGGLPSLASMELMRDSSRDWDTLMAGSADVSDIGNTMVQSVAEFFSF